MGSAHLLLCAVFATIYQKSLNERIFKHPSMGEGVQRARPSSNFPSPHNSPPLAAMIAMTINNSINVKPRLLNIATPASVITL